MVILNQNYMRTIGFLSAVLFLFFSVQQVEAQEVKATKLENPEWVQVNYVRFLPGKREMAEKIIMEYFMKADNQAGNPEPTSFRMITGDYDYILIWDLPEGLETLNYQVNPEDAKWMNEMIKLTGGQEQAGQKMNEFFDYVEVWKTELARKE